MEKNYFSQLGYIANVPSSVIVAVIETAIDGGYEYSTVDYHDRFQLSRVGIDSDGGVVIILFTDVTTHLMTTVTFNGHNHTVTSSATSFSVPMADYICYQVLRLYRLRNFIFNHSDASDNLKDFFSNNVSEKILRSVLVTMDSAVMKHYPKSVECIRVEELNEDLLMLTTGTYYDRKVLYNKRTTQIEFPEECLLTVDATVVCDRIRNYDNK